MESLSDKELQILELAEQWYGDIYGAKTVRHKHVR